MNSIENSVIKGIDEEKLRNIVLDLCNDNEKIIQNIDYYSARYKPESCEEKLMKLREQLYSNTSLIIALSDLLDQVTLENKEWQAMNLADPNSNYGETPIPLKESERSI